MPDESNHQIWLMPPYLAPDSFSFSWHVSSLYCQLTPMVECRPLWNQMVTSQSSELGHFVYNLRYIKYNTKLFMTSF